MASGNQRPDRTPITVAFIGLIGGIIGAVITAAAVIFAPQVVIPNNITVKLEQAAIATAQPTIVAQLQPTIDALRNQPQQVVTQVVTQIVERQVTVVPPTYTPYPTYTPAPTTQPILVTATPTSIAPEGVDTPSGTTLSAGQTWYQQGLSMTLDAAVFEDTVCGGISTPRSDWGTWSVELSNDTDQDLVVNIESTDFYLKDSRNQDAIYNIDYSDAPCGYIGINPPGRINIKTLKAGSVVKMKVYGVGQVGTAEFFIFGIRDGGRIKNAAWQIDVPR